MKNTGGKHHQIFYTITYWIRTITNVLFKPLLPPFKVSFFNETQIPSVSKVKLFEFLRQKYSFEFKVGPYFAFLLKLNREHFLVFDLFLRQPIWFL